MLSMFICVMFKFVNIIFSMFSNFKVLEYSGKSHLEEIWPNLEVFFHGGIAFSPYRHQYEQIIQKSDMHYMETYNASEGFFGIQSDPSDVSLQMMLDYGIFYEFIPMDHFDEKDLIETAKYAVPLSGIETGKNYAMVITNSCGLWRYLIYCSTSLYGQPRPLSPPVARRILT